MTRDEVLALSGEELQAKAAELAGWTHDEEHGIWCHDAKEPRRDAPDYPHAIAAAWELVVAMMAAGHTIAIYADDSVWCTVDEDDDLDSGGTTAPRAITRAFVLAMEGK